MSTYYLFRGGVLVDSCKYHADSLYNIGQPGDVLIHQLSNGTLWCFDWQKNSKDSLPWQPRPFSPITGEMRMQMLLHG